MTIEPKPLWQFVKDLKSGSQPWIKEGWVYFNVSEGSISKDTQMFWLDIESWPNAEDVKSLEKQREILRSLGFTSLVEVPSFLGRFRRYQNTTDEDAAREIAQDMDDYYKHDSWQS